MKNSKKRLQKAIILCICLCIFLCACSCGKPEVTVREIISELVVRDPNLPAGKIYFGDAEEGDDEYMSDSLKSALFGKGNFPSEFELIDSFAVRISSFTIPYEYSVFKVKNVSDTDKICAMCERRIETAKILLKNNPSESGKAIVDTAKIYVSGKYVIMLMSSDNESALNAAKKVLR